MEVYNKEKVETKKDYFKDDFIDDFDEDESPYISPYQKNFLLKQPKEVNKYISLLEKGQVYLFNNSILVLMKYVNLFNINYHIDLEHKQVFYYFIIIECYYINKSVFLSKLPKKLIDEIRKESDVLLI